MRQTIIFVLLAVLIILTACEDHVTEGENVYHEYVDSLYICNFDGSGKIALPYVNSYYNLFSPDGQFIYSIFPDSIVKYNVENSGVTNFVIPHLEFSGDSPRAIDESGTFICFTTQINGSNDLFLFNTTTGDSEVFGIPGYKEGSPAFRKNNLFYFVYNYENVPTRLFSLNFKAKRKETTQILEFDKYVYQLQISEDFASIFYLTGDFKVIKLDMDTMDETVIFREINKMKGFGTSLLWLVPQASRLFYSKGNNEGIAFFDYNGNILLEIMNGCYPSSDNYWYKGTYSTNYDLLKSEIYTIDFQNQTSQLIAEQAGRGLISPDGSKLLYLKHVKISKAKRDL